VRSCVAVCDRPDEPARTAKLLGHLGLRKTPPVEDILKIAADPTDPKRQKAALAYYLNEMDVANQSKVTLDLPYVPYVNADGSAGFAKPSECFSNPDAVIFGFKILHPDYRAEAARFRCVRVVCDVGFSSTEGRIGCPPIHRRLCSSLVSSMTRPRRPKTLRPSLHTCRRVSEARRLP
jgi:hypothetical protein